MISIQCIIFTPDLQKWVSIHFSVRCVVKFLTQGYKDVQQKLVKKKLVSFENCVLPTKIEFSAV